MTASETLQAITQLLNLSALEPLDLLRGYAAILSELRARGIMRTNNNPVADYAEWLVSTRLGLKLEGNSSSGWDATSPDGTRYEIKGRRITSDGGSAQLSAIRNLGDRSFDYLIGVVFGADFSVRYAAKLPHEVVALKASFRQHTNAHILYLSDTIFEDERVEDITELLTT